MEQPATVTGPSIESVWLKHTAISYLSGFVGVVLAIVGVSLLFPDYARFMSPVAALVITGFLLTVRSVWLAIRLLSDPQFARRYGAEG